MRKQSRYALFLVLAALSAASTLHAADSCIDCHENAGKMKDAGYPQFAVTAADVKAQTRMPASCVDCHLGDPAASAKDEAHKGMLTLRAVGRKWNTPTRAEMKEQDVKDWPGLEPRGANRASMLGPKLAEETGAMTDNPDYRSILYHDKNGPTLAFNPGIAEKTCGKCHPDHVKGFLKTAMGGAHGAHVQSQYVFWTSATGPQSCGLWLGKLAEPDQDKFSAENVKIFNRHSTSSIGADVAFNMQRNCNQCHVGCLDCHFRPQKKDAADAGKGPHTFSGKTEALTCYGGSRSFSCHAGPLERRRGDGYLRGEFTQANEHGKKILKDMPDIHAQKGMSCTGCHEQKNAKEFHADLKRHVECAACHAKAVATHAVGTHRKVDCAACHTKLIGGYAFNFWTVGGERGKENPATRIQDYLVDAIPPILIKNPSGIWIPVHVVPHTSGNVKTSEVKLSKRLLFRDRPDAAVERRYPSNDSFAVTGLVRNLDNTDHDTMVWLNVDRVAHATGKSRTCESCHGSTSQKVTTYFSGGSYKDVEDGSYTIIADEKGLRVADFKGPDNGPVPSGLVPFLNKWNLKGNFSIPKLKEKNLYEKLEKDYEAGRFEH
jgi:hypothetical protein